MEDRRRFSRVPFAINSTLSIDGRLFDAKVIDISLRGALVSTPSKWSPHIDEELMLEMQLVNSDVVLLMKTTVVHGHGAALGLKFNQIDIDSLSHLRRLMELNVGDAALIDQEVRQLIELSLLDDNNSASEPRVP